MSDVARSLDARSVSSHSMSGTLRRELLVKRVLQWSVLGTALVVVIFPMYWMLLTAFDPPTLSYSAQISLMPKRLTFAAFSQLLREYDFLRWMLNSATVAIISTLLGAIPVVGGFIAFAASLYGLYLTYLAIQSGMNLPSNKALYVILILFLLLLAVFCFIFGAAFLALMGAGALQTAP